MPLIVQNAELDNESLVRMSPDEIEWIYNALDCCVTSEVLHQLNANMDDVARNTYSFSRALQGPILEMQLRGTKIDPIERVKVLEEYRAERKFVRQHLVRLAEEGLGLGGFNYRSPPQLKNLFYTVLGCPVIRARSSNGKFTPTVNRDALERLQQNYTAEIFCRHIITLRELDKKIQFLETEIDEDGRIRTTFNIAGTNTGRLSSSDSAYGTGTNLQNIERKLRKVYVADEGFKLCNIDLEQADARNVGAIIWNLFRESHGEVEAGKYLDACESGDLHTRVCSMAYTDLPWTDDLARDKAIADDKENYAYREWTYRDMSKRLGHGTNFFGTPRNMGHILKLPSSQVDSFQQRYFAGFPLIGSYNKKDTASVNWHNWVRNQISDYSFIITPGFERRRYFFGRPNDDRTLREAIAYAPQSMTADEIDTGIIRLWRSDLPIHLLIQVHDSILFQYPEELEAEVVPAAMEMLKVVIELAKGREFFVPVEAKIGWNWSDQEVHRDGTIENEFGLMKWKGPGEDKRKRPKQRALEAFSMEALIT